MHSKRYENKTQVLRERLTNKSVLLFISRLPSRVVLAGDLAVRLPRPHVPHHQLLRLRHAHEASHLRGLEQGRGI